MKPNELPGWFEQKYEFKPYPKWIETAAGPVIVQNEAEENEFLKHLPPEEEKPRRGRPKKAE